RQRGRCADRQRPRRTRSSLPPPRWRAPSRRRVSALARRIFSSSGGRPFGALGRKGDGGGGAGAELAVQGKAAAMHLHEGWSEGQTQTGALEFPVEAAVDLAERCHHLVEIFPPDADAGIGDGDS